MADAEATRSAAGSDPAARAAPAVPGGVADDPCVVVGREVAVLADRLGDTRLRAAADTVTVPPALVLRGRPGVGVSSVAAALRGAGLAVAGDAGGAGDGPTMLVVTESPTPEDREVIGSDRAGVALLVMTRADLAGTPPMATARRRCAELTASTGVPAVPVVAHLAAGVDLDGKALAALRAAATGTPPDLRSVDALLDSPHLLPRDVRARLLAALDLFGIAHAVAALRTRPELTAAALAAVLAAAAGTPDLVAQATAALAIARHRRVSAAVAALRRIALVTSEAADAVDATLARLAAARAAVAAQVPPTRGAVAR